MAEMGVHSVAYAFPQVKIITTAVDKKVNDLFHIIPGIGEWRRLEHEDTPRSGFFVIARLLNWPPLLSLQATSGIDTSERTLRPTGATTRWTNPVTDGLFC